MVKHQFAEVGCTHGCRSLGRCCLARTRLPTGGSIGHAVPTVGNFVRRVSEVSEVSEVSNDISDVAALRLKIL